MHFLHAPEGFGATWVVSARIRAWLVRFGVTRRGPPLLARRAEVPVQEHGGGTGRTTYGSIGGDVPGVGT